MMTVLFPKLILINGSILPKDADGTSFVAPRKFFRILFAPSGDPMSKPKVLAFMLDHQVIF